MKVSIIDTPKEINISDQKITKKELYDAINKASTHIDTIIKLYKEKEDNYIVIFSWQDRNKWKIDFPIQQHRIHKQRYISHKQCLQLSQEIFAGRNSLDDLIGFLDVPVRHFTLDEMLDFKKEDEMMLNGQDPDQYSKKQPKELSKPETAPVAQQTPAAAPTTEPAIKKTTPKPVVKKATKPTSTPKKPTSPSTTDDDIFFSL